MVTSKKEESLKDEFASNWDNLSSEQKNSVFKKAFFDGKFTVFSDFPEIEKEFKVYVNKIMLTFSIKKMDLLGIDEETRSNLQEGKLQEAKNKYDKNLSTKRSTGEIENIPTRGL
jgi:hypothetical protein